MPIRADQLYELIEKQTGRRSTISGSGPDAERPSHVDWEHAFETVGGERELLSELIHVFLKDQSQLLAKIENAVERKDEKELRLTAHTIKGALTHLGGREAANLAAALELMGQNENLDNAEAVLVEFRSSLSLMTYELKRFVSVDGA